MSKATAAIVFGAVLIVGLAAATRQPQARIACLYEVLVYPDSVVIGWLPVCDPTIDMRVREDHMSVNHNAIPAPCGQIDIWVWPGIPSPVADTVPARCDDAKRLERRSEDSTVELWRLSAYKGL